MSCSSTHFFTSGKARSSLFGIVLVVLGSQQHVSQAQDIRLQQGDHVVYIGNTLADRMQHHGWLETYIHALLPEHELTFRNLGFSGDEVILRQRANNFGDADQWLTKCKADVIACFFGYNEALKGDEGLSKFAKDFTETLSHMQRQSYNGRSAPTLIVFSPIAHENMNSPHLPSGEKNNRNLENYSLAMRKVCQSLDIDFVDLFEISKRLYAEADQPLTMNGIHLLDHGNQALAREIIAQFAPNETLPSAAQIAKLRESVLDKNYHWFSRYRVVDEYNVFGGRSKLAWFGQSNADVMMREMEIFDVKTENRDRKIWATAQGRDYEVVDNNLPEEVSVRPNKKGPLEGGAFPYLDGEEAIGQMQVGDGLEVNLFASESQFPRLVNPVQMSVDADSRLWASVWPSYPHWNPTQPRKDALVILPDEDNDGRADELIVFADELNSITGFEFWGGGVLVAAPPEIWFLKDTDGDDRADQKIRVLQGVSSADTHHSANAMVVGPDGWLYWSRGVFNVAAFETPTQTYRSGRTGVHRFNPRTFECEFHYPIGPNPHGDVFDRWGYQFANDGTSGTGGHVSIGKGQRPGNRQWFKKEWRPVAATGILSSSHFPNDYQNDFLICNTIGFLGVLRYDVQYNGAEITATRTTDLIQSSDPNFRPSDIEVGGDGAVYVADWHNTLIGHMQHNMRDPNRDHSHGRIYRVSAKGRRPLPPVKMKGKPIAEVLSNFFSQENSVRYRARLELSGRESNAVAQELARFTAGLNPTNASRKRDEDQALLECLWVYEEHRIPNLDLLRKTFAAAEPRVRAAAIRTLGHWADRIDQWEPLLTMAAADESALVRAEAAKAAVEFEGLTAAEVIFTVATAETDPELQDVLSYARSEIAIDQMITDAIRSKKELSEAARTYALSNAQPSMLLEMERSDAVFNALLSRENVSAKLRWSAIDHFAAKNGKGRVQQLIATISDNGQLSQQSLADLAGMLSQLDAQQLVGTSQKLNQLIDSTQSADVRKAAYTAWFTSGNIDAAWSHALRSRESLSDALNGMQAITDSTVGSKLSTLARPLMFKLPKALQGGEDSSTSGSGSPVSFEYFEPNPAQNVSNETLDKATPKFIGTIGQFSTFVPNGRRDAFATRQIASLVVSRAGRYTFYTTSDDGSRLYVNDRLVVNNDGTHGMSEASGRLRLSAGVHKLTLTYFDNGGGDGLVVSWSGPGINKQSIPATVLRPVDGGNLQLKTLETIALLPGDIRTKIDDFAQLSAVSSMPGAALNALAGLPTDSVADNVSRDSAEAVISNLLAVADQATPVEKQTSEFSRLLALGNGLLAKAGTGRDVSMRKLASLRASIPVRADPSVMALGKEVYSRESHCATCHQPHGQGLPNLYPPLDDSLWVTGSEERMIRLVLDGMHGTIEVKGKTYSSPPLPPMTGFRHLLNDEEIAAVITYARNSWSNRAKPVDPQKVAEIRAIRRSDDAAFWAVNDLMDMYPLEDGREPLKQASTDGWIPKLVKEWKESDFSLQRFQSAEKSFSAGQLAYQRVGCTQCHKLGIGGGLFGPNLAELDIKKKTFQHIVTAIVDPSKDVDPKYAMKTYLLDTGKVVSGFIVEETETQLQLMSDPLGKKESMVVIKEEIEDESLSAKSVMPQGLLNWLAEEEVYDLVAYVLSGGNSSHSSYNK